MAKMTEEELKVYYESLDPMERVLSYRQGLLWRLDTTIYQIYYLLCNRGSKSKAILALDQKYKDTVWKKEEEGYPLLHGIRLSSQTERNAVVRKKIVPAIRELRKEFPAVCPLIIKNGDKEKIYENYKALLQAWDTTVSELLEDLESDPDDSYSSTDERVLRMVNGSK